MTSSRIRPPVLHGGSMPPSFTSDYMPPAPLGLPPLARMANRSRARTLATYRELEEEINRTIETKTRQVELKSAYLEANARAVGRAERLDDIREMAGLEISMQLAEMRKVAEIRSKQGDVELARLEVQLKAARHAADQYDRIPQQREAANKSPTDELVAAFDEARQTEAAFDREIARIISEGGGSEEALTEDAHDMLDHLRVAKANRLATIYERIA